MNPSPGGRDHEVLRERLGAYVLDGLDAAERDEVDAHLAGCSDCRAELAAIAPLARPLRSVDPDAVTAPPPSSAPPAGFDEILRRVREEPAAPVVPLAPRRRTRRTAPLVAAGVLVVALAAGAAGYGFGVRSAQGPREPVAVQALAPGVEADAATIGHTWGVEVVLTARGFDADAPTSSR